MPGPRSPLSQGFEAQQTGKSRDDCPYPEGPDPFERREQWMAGFERGETNRKEA